MSRTHVRRVRATLLVAVSLAVGVGFLAGRASAGDDMEPASTPHPIVADVAELVADGTVYVVRPGDTLWDIAARLTGKAGDPRVVVDVLAEANGLQGRMILPGDRLVVP